ncbi:MAG: S9 family peptidase [Phycisphaerae bacterium]|nr:S9 family peptidase [Phycisphaerae bacterium]
MWTKRLLLFALLSIPAFVGCTRTTMKHQTALMERAVLFSNPDKAGVKISPDGTKLAYLAPVDGVLNIWYGPLADPGIAMPVTHDTHRGIRAYFWAYTNHHIVYAQDKDGDENWRVYCVDLETGKTKDLTPAEGVRAQIQEVSPKFPNEILVGLNDRNPQLIDIHRVNIITGEKTLVLENDGFAGFLTDDNFAVRMAMRVTPDGGSELLRQTDNGWESFIKIKQKDTLTTSPMGFDKSGKTLYMRDSRDRNTSALSAVNIETGEKKIIAEDPKSDIRMVLRHPTDKTIQAVGSNYLRRNWQFFDLKVAADFDVLRTVADGDVNVISRSLDDKHWIIAFTMDDGPTRYYHYDRGARKPCFLFTNRKSLKGLPLATMHPLIIKSRDGLDMISYLTLPVGTDPDADARPSSLLPMVLLVHGGPWYRDSWGYDPQHQWLANRGYAVLSVNFRGSTGFGKAFVNAGNMEMSGKMHDDLIDAVNWAVDERIADPKRVAIMGASYGGYATLVGLTFTPKVFACGVDIVGPSSMITLLESIPPYWAPAINMFTSRMGDHRTEEGRKFLNKCSPLNYVDKICKPLLIGQGANDPRVKQTEADQIVAAMQARKIPVTYVLYPDEGHGFARPENNMSFNAVTEAFLAEHLGGRYEPIGDDFKDSSLQVPTGKGNVAGLSKALAKMQ